MSINLMSSLRKLLLPRRYASSADNVHAFYSRDTITKHAKRNAHLSVAACSWYNNDSMKCLICHVFFLLLNIRAAVYRGFHKSLYTFDGARASRLNADLEKCIILLIIVGRFSNIKCQTVALTSCINNINNVYNFNHVRKNLRQLFDREPVDAMRVSQTFKNVHLFR